jgi:hypothetical protein
VEKPAQSLGVAQLSKSQVSAMAKHLDEQVAALRNRPQGASPYAFVRADAGWPAFLRSLRRALALRKEDRPPQRRIAVTVRDVNRRTRSQENLNSQWSLGLSREMQRPPARVVDCLHGGAYGQEHLQAITCPSAAA